MYTITKKHILNDDDVFYKMCVEYVLSKMSYLNNEYFEINVIDVDDSDDLLKSMGGACCISHIVSFPGVNGLGTFRAPSNSISICKDIHKLFEDTKELLTTYDSRFTEFMKSLDVPVNKRSMFLWTLLHEVGHAHIFTLFSNNEIIKEVPQALEDFNTFAIGSSNASILFSKYEITDKFSEKYQINLPQFVNGLEAQCDLFANKHFLPAWKVVKDSKGFTFK